MALGINPGDPEPRCEPRGSGQPPEALQGLRAPLGCLGRGVCLRSVQGSILGFKSLGPSPGAQPHSSGQPQGTGVRVLASEPGPVSPASPAGHREPRSLCHALSLFSGAASLPLCAAVAPRPSRAGDAPVLASARGSGSARGASRLGVSGRWLRARAAGQAQCGGSRAWGPPHSTRATRGTEGHRAAPLQRPPRLLLGRGCAHGRGAHAVTVGTPGLRGTAEAVSTRGHGRFAPRPQGVGLAARPRRARGAAALCRTPAAPPAPGSQPRRDPRGGLRGPPTASPSPPRSAGGVLAPHQITARKPVEEKRATAATAAPGPGCFPQLPLPPEPPPGALLPGTELTPKHPALSLPRCPCPCLVSPSLPHDALVATGDPTRGLRAGGKRGQGVGKGGGWRWGVRRQL